MGVAVVDQGRVGVAIGMDRVGVAVVDQDRVGLAIGLLLSE